MEIKESASILRISHPPFDLYDIHIITSFIDENGSTYIGALTIRITKDTYASVILDLTHMQFTSCRPSSGRFVPNLKTLVLM